MNYHILDGKCGTETAFKVFGGRWTPWILHVCSSNEPRSFKDIQARLPGLSDSTLVRQLNNLILNGMLIKDASKKYCLTQRALDLEPTLVKMQELAYICGYVAEDYSSAIEYSSKIIGNKWKARIIWILNTQRSVRFNTIMNSIEGLSHKVLKENLDTFIDYGLIERTDFSGKSPHVEYKLTAKGHFAFNIIDELAEWCKNMS